MGEKTTHIHLNVDVPEDPSDIDVDKQKVIQSRESDKNETTLSPFPLIVISTNMHLTLSCQTCYVDS